MVEEANCIFCKIVAGKAQAKLVFDGGDTLFFHDIHPKAPVHVVGITKQHLESLAKMHGDDHAVIGKLLHEAAHVAKELGIEARGYRVITNVGADAGQEIQHFHIHVLGGEPLGPMRSS